MFINNYKAGLRMVIGTLDELLEECRFKVIAERRFLLRSIFGQDWRRELGAANTSEENANLQSLIVKSKNWIPPIAVKRFLVLERAVKKFADKTFGVCDGCNQPICYERLSANPSAAYCLPCQIQVEAASVKSDSLS